MVKRLENEKNLYPEKKDTIYMMSKNKTYNTIISALQSLVTLDSIIS